MKRLITALMAIAFLATAAPAEARKPVPTRSSYKAPKKDGRWARGKVRSYYKARGLSTRNIRVTKIRFSKSNKSSQVAVSTKASGKVRLFNVTHRNGKVSATRTGLVSQSKARGKANQVLRRENKPNKGTFSGVNNSGLTQRGNYKFNSATDRNERAVVNIKTGGLRRYDR